MNTTEGVALEVPKKFTYLFIYYKNRTDSTLKIGIIKVLKSAMEACISTYVSTYIIIYYTISTDLSKSVNNQLIMQLLYCMLTIP